jgi:hypothetical protein
MAPTVDAPTRALESARPTPLARWRALLARHAVGIAVAVALGLLIVMPRWWLLATDPSSGTRAPVTVWGASDMGSDEALQTTTIRDAYDGELPVRAAHLVNHRDAPFQAGAGWQELIGIAGHLFGGPFVSLAVFTTLMAVAAFVTLYVLASELTSSRLGAIMALPIGALFAHVFFHLDGYATREQWRYLEPFLTLDPQREFLAWTRFLTPVMVLATFFTLALALPRAAAGAARQWSVVASLALALLIYSYVYYWTAAALAIALWMALLLYRRELDAARRVIVISLVAVVVALPELAIVVNKALTSTPDIQARVGQGDLGIVWGEGSEILLRIIIGLPFLYTLRRRPVEHGLYVALFVAPLALVAIDGVMPQPWHYRSQVWSTFAIPAFVAGAAQLYGMLDLAQRRLIMRGGMAFAACALVYMVALQIRATAIVDDAYALNDDEHAAFEWIERNVDTGETVASPSIITTLLMDNLTPAAGYIIGGYNPVADDDELIDRYLRIQVVFGYDEAATFARLDPDNEFPFDYEGPAAGLEREVEQHVAFYTFYWEVTTPGRLLARMPGWQERFRQLARGNNVISAYPVDYLYCGPRERLWPAAQPREGTFVQGVFHQGEVTVYRLTDGGGSGAVFTGC